MPLGRKTCDALPVLRPRTSPAPALVLGILLLSSRGALAQGTGPKDDLATLEKNLAAEHAALSTSDCTTACRALASIRRAADKICALEPGERCAAGRAKADDATKRVREACPECAIATAPPQPAPEREERAMSKGGHPSADSASPVAANAPPSESKRGGCAGCATTPTSPGDMTTAALAMSALAFTLRRRRKRTITPSR
jgi:MYXO-CTERM domain-containing protein